MKQKITFVVLFLVAMLCTIVTQATQKSFPDSVKTWSSETTCCVGVFDIKSLKIKEDYFEVKEEFKANLPHSLTGPNEVTKALEIFEKGLEVFESKVDKLLNARAEKAFLFIDTEKYNKSFPFILVIPFDKTKINSVQEFLADFKEASFIPEDQRANFQNALYKEIIDDCIVLAVRESNSPLTAEEQKGFFDNLKKSCNGKLDARFEEIAQGKTAAIQIYFVPTGKLADMLANKDTTVAQVVIPENTYIDGIQAVTMQLDLNDFEIQFGILSKDNKSAKNLYTVIKSMKSSFVEGFKTGVAQNIGSSNVPVEWTLLATDLFNWFEKIFTPEIKDNTFTWSVTKISDNFSKLCPKIDRDPKAGLEFEPSTKQSKNFERIYNTVSQFLNKQVFMVVHIDTEGLKFEQSGDVILHELKRLLPQTFSGQSEVIEQTITTVQTTLQDLDKICKKIKEVGGRDIFIICSFDKILPVKIIVPFDRSEKAEAKKLVNLNNHFRLLSEETNEQWEEQYFKASYHDCLIFGIKANPNVEKSEFRQSLKEFESEEVKEYRQAFLETVRSPVKAVVYIPTLWQPITPFMNQLRISLENQSPTLANLLPSFTDQQLSDSIRAIAWEFNFQDMYTNLHIISKNEKSALAFQKFLQECKSLFAESNRLQHEKTFGSFAPNFLRDFSIDNAESGGRIWMPELNGNILSFRSNTIIERWNAETPKCMQNKNALLLTAVGGFLLGLTIPLLQSSQQSNYELQNSNNLKQLALVMINYEKRHSTLPPVFTEKAGKRLHSWRVLLLPYLDETRLYDQIRLDEPWDSEWNKQFHDKCPKVFKNPAVKLAPDETTYAVVVGEKTIFTGAKGCTLSSIKDGLSNTGMITECKPVCWMDPNSDILFEEAIKGVGKSENGIQSYFKGIITVVIADGSVKPFPSTVASDFLYKLFNKSDGKTLDYNVPEQDNDKVTPASDSTNKDEFEDEEEFDAAKKPTKNPVPTTAIPAAAEDSEEETPAAEYSIPGRDN